MKFYVYMMYNDKHDMFYIGQTYSLKKRIFEHKNKLSKFTSKYDGTWFFVYKEEYKTRSEAMKRENFLKKQRNKIFYKNLCRPKKG